jgi:hypothetical protein
MRYVEDERRTKYCSDRCGSRFRYLAGVGPDVKPQRDRHIKRWLRESRRVDPEYEQLPPDREYAEPLCITRLSLYNPGTYCRAHSRMRAHLQSFPPGKRTPSP